MKRQTSIFPETELPLPTDACAGAELVLSALKFGGGPVSPAQKRFNQLLSQTEALASKIEAARALADAHRRVHAQTLAPLETERNALVRQMALWLDERLQHKGLSAKQKATAREILCHLAAQLAGVGDEAMRALYAKHNETSLEDEEKADAADLKMFMEDILGEKMGTDDTPFDNLEDLLRASMTKMQQKADADAAHQANRKSKRKKSATQLKAEATATAQTEDATGALRTIYRQLASALHPDRETDSQEQLRKTTLMKEANAAYERRDLLSLLQLQLRAELTDTSQMANMAQEKLAALTSLLKDRVKVLNDELIAVELQMVGEFNLPMFTTLSAAGLRRHLNECELNLREEISMMKQDLVVVQDDARLKHWLREQQQASQNDFDPLCPF